VCRWFKDIIAGMKERLDPKKIADKTQRSAIDRKQKRGERPLPEEEAFLEREKAVQRDKTAGQEEKTSGLEKFKGDSPDKQSEEKSDRKKRYEAKFGKAEDAPAWMEKPFNVSRYKLKPTVTIEKIEEVLGVQNNPVSLVEALDDEEGNAMGSILDEETIIIDNNHPRAEEYKKLLADYADFEKDNITYGQK